ncbi:hypothetical protein IE4803_CH02462 [Rhizobium etli bv. phaseoli str. IE4803]|nr:hypothetical protein IE4803_CH02462 [Rhizobium etli bv. phaseoli str. IE4803]
MVVDLLGHRTLLSNGSRCSEDVRLVSPVCRKGAVFEYECRLRPVRYTLIQSR